MKAMGFTPVSGEDEMGDLIITGDIEIDKKTTDNGNGKLIAGAISGAAIPFAIAAGWWLGQDREPTPKPNTPVIVETVPDNSNTIRPDDTL